MLETDRTPPDDDSGEEEQERQEIIEEIGEDRRDPTTGSLIDAEDLRSIPEEVTGRAGETGEDLTALFRNASGDHMTDGFRGGSDEEGLEENPGEPGLDSRPTPDAA